MAPQPAALTTIASSAGPPSPPRGEGRRKAERRTVGAGELPGRLVARRVVVQRPATDLGPRHPHLAAVALEDAGGGQRRLRQEGVAGAAEEQRHPRPPLSLRG